MYYVKSQITDECSIYTEITDENVFTICPNCGVEHQIDLVDLIQSGEFCLFSTAIYCKECSDKCRLTEREGQANKKDVIADELKDVRDK